ncbi:MAG TPA: tetratricopeptide repeat protein [Burkholderiales bacterium]
MKSPIRPLIIALLLAPAAAYAADSGPTPARDPVLEGASAATERKDWPAAQAILKEAVAKDPGNADYHNLYAYSIRKGANPDMSLVFKHYNEALRLDPTHRGAHEYIGEAYLMVGNLPKAKEHLGQLDKLCFLPCGEYSDLKRTIAEFEAGRR